MIDSLLGINLIVSLPIFVLGIVLTGFIPYLLGYRFFGRTADGKTKEVANILFRAVVCGGGTSRKRRDKPA